MHGLTLPSQPCPMPGRSGHGAQASPDAAWSPPCPSPKQALFSRPEAGMSLRPEPPRPPAPQSEEWAGMPIVCMRGRRRCVPGARRLRTPPSSPPGARPPLQTLSSEPGTQRRVVRSPGSRPHRRHKPGPAMISVKLPISPTGEKEKRIDGAAHRPNEEEKLNKQASRLRFS